ncbi:hypothetical protein QBC34DRAFT_67644 [Podospora aff. communis PSN243]|uniref:Zn(2)-C6 fungal-type domain-containing protein n=1 Tax=Podospora aff. communis PSN243 TaxID=3040156 RepID=A0AAV9H8L1_9PEZI|nr:hypothetical protein QBC34DRAFT_67644 [Podospora aff. communis PSN243]
MVYGGRPSRGCRTCRTRRIKCDEGKPTCQQCAKSKRECGGYRSEFEIVHRDQTKSTVRRMRKALEGQSQTPKQPAATPTTSVFFVHEQSQLQTPAPSPQEQTELRSQQYQSPSPRPNLTIPIAQRASCFFASNFILVSSANTPHGFMEHLVPLLETTLPDSALSYAFNACAFAALGNRVSAENVDFAALSLKQHTNALVRTQVALGDPATANTDATLASVLLLSLYESITATKSTGLLAWRSHIDGAVDIVQARGGRMMCNTKTGAHLFNAVRHLLLSRTLSAGVSPPAGVDYWVDENDTTFISTCHRFVLKTSEMRVEVSRLLAGGRRGEQYDHDRVVEMSKRVQALDHEIAAWLAELPPAYRFRTVCWIEDDNTDSVTGAPHDKDEVFPGRIDVYPDYVTASAWNIARVTRMILGSIGIRITAWLFSPVDYRTTPEYSTWKAICAGNIAEIIASVPYHLGWHTKQRHILESNPQLSGFVCGEEVPLKALPAFLLIWSLVCLRTHDASSDEQRAWAEGRLRFIADSVGIRYAHALSELNLRFPSMMIREDGQMEVPDVLLNGKIEVPVALRPKIEPQTPDSVDSHMKIQRHDDWG